MKDRTRGDFRPVREKSIDEIEGRSLEPPYVSGMVERIAQARREPIGRLGLLDLRLLVSQREAPRYLLPLALEHLERDPLADAGIYRGDLLRAVLRNDDTYGADAELRVRVRGVLAAAVARLERIQPTPDGELPDPDEPDEFDRMELEPDLRAALAALDASGGAV